MLVVKTSVKQSSIEGLGLFAEEKIPKGTTIWKYDPVIDITFEPAQVEKMSLEHQKLIYHYAYLSINSGKYVYSIDNTRFANHSAAHSNMIAVAFPGELETRGVAVRDIDVGEEILVDYRTIDAEDLESKDSYLSV